MNIEKIKSVIDRVFDNNEDVNPNTSGEIRISIETALDCLDKGELRVAEPLGNSKWQVNQWLKKAVLLSFKINDMDVISGGPQSPNSGPTNWWDKIPSKFSGWNKKEFKQAGFRAVPGSVVRHSAFIVNIGAYVDSGSMIDTWATVGSCAQIGKNVHISGGAGIGGVLEPIQAGPVIIEDDCFVGARSEVAEGVVIETGAVLSMGVFIGASTKVVDRNTGEVFVGRVPAYSVVVPGSLPGKSLPDGSQGPSLYCAVIVKKVDAQTRSKTSVNELLRD